MPTPVASEIMFALHFQMQVEVDYLYSLVLATLATVFKGFLEPKTTIRRYTMATKAAIEDFDVEELCDFVALTGNVFEGGLIT